MTFRRAKPTLTLKPSEYFRRQCFVSVEADEDFVKQVIDSMGDDTIVFSTDWPHGDSNAVVLAAPPGSCPQGHGGWGGLPRFRVAPRPGDPHTAAPAFSDLIAWLLAGIGRHVVVTDYVEVLAGLVVADLLGQ